VFFYEEAGMSFAEMPPERKNAVSHRGKALEQFGEKLSAYLAKEGKR
jgi:XTP/dITP diphosphohydrolase